VLLNILTEHDYQDAFEHDRHAGNNASAQKRATLRVMVASRSKVSSWPDGCNNLRNYGEHSWINKSKAKGSISG
jgi:hypothetical protein